MCTVSVIGWADGFRLACNRDELRSRPIATPPVIRRFGDREAILPTDPQSGGTWIAVNEAGLCFVVLHLNPRVRLTADELRGRLSRGTIIPLLLHCDDIEEAVALGHRLNPAGFPPFRLIVLDRHARGEFSSDGRTVVANCRPFNGAPLMFTSSGLGDALVERPRRELFDRMVRARGGDPAKQDAFHRHRWPDRPHLSVLMSRDDACTVSRTIVEVFGHANRMKYLDDGDIEHVRDLRTLRRIS